jgi:hypothetical protein
MIPNLYTGIPSDCGRDFTLGGASEARTFLSALGMVSGRFSASDGVGMPGAAIGTAGA